MRALRHGNRAATWNGGSGERGQGLVEFALVIPIFVTLLMGVIEFGFLYNNLLTVQYAARQGVSAAAQAGGVDGADCSILNAVEHALTPPINHQRVEFVEIFRSDSAGYVARDPTTNKAVLNRYTRVGTLDCPGTGTQPYTLSGTEDYPQIGRHDALVEGLDVIGVRIGYQYVGMTPVAFGRTWDLTDGATLRMEPKQ
jgi:Flp pilus assembly protein TadG